RFLFCWMAEQLLLDGGIAYFSDDGRCPSSLLSLCFPPLSFSPCLSLAGRSVSCLDSCLEGCSACGGASRLTGCSVCGFASRFVGCSVSGFESGLEGTG